MKIIKLEKIIPFKNSLLNNKPISKIYYNIFDDNILYILILLIIILLIILLTPLKN